MLKSELSKAIESLNKGEIIVYPTDTQYAFGADIFNDDSIRKVFEIKNRSYNNPLPIAVAKYDDIIKYTYKNKFVKSIYERFLPGKLTVILYKKGNISNLLTAGMDKIAIRIPKNKIALELLSKFGPLTVTSANIHGNITQSTIKDISLDFKEEISCYLDDGLLNNEPSTIVDLTGNKPKILREGKISLEDILAVI
jgi:L-threonylcarbamoyladenylate synthase